MHSGTGSTCTDHLVPVEMQILPPHPDLLQGELGGWEPAKGFEGALQGEEGLAIVQEPDNDDERHWLWSEGGLGVNSLARCEALVKNRRWWRR